MADRNSLVSGSALMIAGGAIMTLSFFQLGSPPALDDPIGPMGLARAMALILVGSGLAIAVGSLRRGTKADPRATLEDAAPEELESAAPSIDDGSDVSVAVVEAEVHEAEKAALANKRVGFLSLGLVVLYVALLPWLGFLAASILLGFALLAALGLRKPAPLLLGATTAATLIYGVFTYVLGVRLP